MGNLLDLVRGVVVELVDLKDVVVWSRGGRLPVDQKLVFVDQADFLDRSDH